MADALAGFLVPGNRSLSLVGDAHGHNIILIDIAFLHHIFTHRQGVCPNLHGIMADPTQIVDDLPVGPIRSAYQDSIGIEQQALGALGGLIHGQNVFHSATSVSRRRALTAMFSGVRP